MKSLTDKLRAAAELALEALSEVDNCTYINDYGDAALDTAYESGMVDKAIAALRAALAEQQEPDDIGVQQDKRVFARIEAMKNAPHPSPRQSSQQPQEPVASIYITPSGEREFDDWRHDLPVGRNLLYTAPQPAQRVPLTDDEIWKNDAIMATNSGYGATFETLREIVRAIEAAHGIRKTK